jgi:protein tyrosine/serine phosphatase
MVRAAQPWPFQLRRWRDKGLKTVINLRGDGAGSAYALERDACANLGLRLINFRVNSREAPTSELINAAERLFEHIEYPALMHCKSGADRAGFMSVLYAHFQLGQPIEAALAQLSWRYLHVRSGRTGILSHFFERYLADGPARGMSLVAWTGSDRYDPERLRDAFEPRWWGKMLVDGVGRRE